MKIFSLLCLLSTVFLLPADVMAAESVAVKTDETELKAQSAGKSFDLSIPADWQQCFLKLDARLLHPKRMRGGSHYALQVKFNDEYLDGSRLVNYPSGVYYRTVSGSALYVYSRVHRTYRTIYSPDFKRFAGAAQNHNPEIAPEYPYTFVFDVSDLVRRNRKNTLLLANKVRNYPFTVFCRNIELKREFSGVTAAEAENDTGKLDGVIVPQKDFTVDYRCRMNRGELLLEVAGERYRVRSQFSEPGGKWNSFTGGRSAGNWQITEQKKSSAGRGFELIGKGKYYSVQRSVQFYPSHISVSDRITNLSDKDLGMICRSSVIDDGTISEVRMAGRVIPSMSGSFNEQVRNSENPTVYVRKKQSGLGLFVRDDVFRANLMIEGSKKRSYGVKNRRLVLEPGKSYTAVLDIYPTDKPDYFAFVNAARRVLDVNFQIDGNLSFAHGFDKVPAAMPDQKYQDFIRFNRPRYIGLNSMRGSGADGNLLPANRLEHMTWGSVTLLDDNQQYTRKALKEAQRRFLAADPQVKFVVYHNCFIGAIADPQKRYSDSSLWYHPQGKLVKYVLNASRMVPRLDNQWGRELQNVYKLFKQNRWGLFWDESTAEPYMADNCHDGFTGEVDPKTFQLKRKLRNVVLDTLQFRLAVLDDFQKNGLPVWCNFMPCTDSMTKKKVYRFVEGHDPLSALRTHFYTPISWGSAYMERNEEDITTTMKNHLAHGGLFMYYTVKFTSDNNFMQKLYPFTPLELHAGYIIGREKILTMRSGSFGWGDKSAVSVEIYDKTGHLTRRKSPVKSDPHYGNYAVIDLRSGEFAIIYRNAVK